MNVLWLPSWYPCRTSSTNGDFIERHAKAVAPFVDTLTVIVVVKDDSMPVNTSEIVRQQEGNITTYRAYYGPGKWGGTFEKIHSLKKYLSIQQQVFNDLLNSTGKPDIVHVHVAMKAGIFARKIKQQLNIPYVLTEHWTAYNKLAKPNIFDMGNYFRRSSKKIMKDAALLLPVSDDLGKTINENLVSTPYKVVPNVVDTTLFYPEQNIAAEKLKLIHVSSMEYQKNMEAMMEGLSIWKQQGGNFTMQLFGPVKENIQLLVNEMGLKNNIEFKGELMQSALAPAMRQADVLLLYSRYETFGCVLIEANACGIPVIVSDLPVFHELITQNVNGVFVNQNNPTALAAALANLAKHTNEFDKAAIANSVKERFSYDVVGKQIRAVYDEVLGRRC